MAAHKYQATFTDGSTATRGSDREYLVAVRRQTEYRRTHGYAPWVTFHGSVEAARKDMSTFVEMVLVEDLKSKAS